MDHAPIEAPAADAHPLNPACVVEREALLEALQLLARIVEKRNTIPILSNVLLQPGEGGGLRMSATDLDILFAMEIEAEWTVPGSLTVAAYTLRDVVKSTPKGSAVTLEYNADTGRLGIHAGRIRTALAVLPAGDFPDIGFEGDGAVRFDLPSDTFCRDLAALAPAMSREESRYYLNGAALQLLETDGETSLMLVATDGAQLVRIARPMPDGAEGMPNAILPRKAAAFITRKLAKAAPAALDISITCDRARIAGAGWSLITKLIDGTFPDWQRAIDISLGEGGLQTVAMIELDERLAIGKIATLAKAAGAELHAETGEKAAALRSPDYPEYLAISMFNNPDAVSKFGINYYEHAEAHIVRYAQALAEAAGLPVLPGNFVYGGVTFGKSEYIRPAPIERQCFVTFTTAIEYPEPYLEYEPGSYSVAVPASHRSLVAAGIEGEGEARPLGTNAAGEIALSEAVVRAMAGDVADLPQVYIKPLQFLHGEIVEGYYFPGAFRSKGKRSRMSDRDAILAYCADPAGHMESIRARPMPAAAVAVEPVAAASDERSEIWDALTLEGRRGEFCRAVAAIAAMALSLKVGPATADEIEATETRVRERRELGEAMRAVRNVAAMAMMSRDPVEAPPAPAAAGEMDALRAENEIMRRAIASLESRLAALEGANMQTAPEICESYVQAPAPDAEICEPVEAVKLAEAEQLAGDFKAAAIRLGAENVRMATALAEVTAERDQARRKATEHLDLAQSEAERAVDLTRRLLEAEAELARLKPLAAALATIQAVPAPAKHVLVDAGGRPLVARA